jgi:putative NADH-flavin reductase
MNIVIYAANSLVGQAVVKRALANSYNVTAFIEDSHKFFQKHKNLRVLEGNFLDPVRIDRALWGQDAVLITFGTGIDLRPLRLFSTSTQLIIKSMRQQKIQRVVCLSTAWLFYRDIPSTYSLIVADHSRQVEVIRNSPLEWVAVCPPEVTRQPAQRKYRIAKSKLPNLGMHISKFDVADLMLSQLHTDDNLYQLIGIAQ